MARMVKSTASECCASTIKCSPLGPRSPESQYLTVRSLAPVQRIAVLTAWWVWPNSARRAAAMAALTCRRSLPDHGGIKPALRAIAGNRLPANGSSARRRASLAIELEPMAPQWFDRRASSGSCRRGLLMASSYHAGFTRLIPHGICATGPPRMTVDVRSSLWISVFV